MSQRDVACIVTAASQGTVSAIWQYAFNYGPDNFGIRLSADGQEPATHFGCYGAGTDTDLAIAWQALTDGVLPEADWGGDFLPSEQDAIADCGNDNLTIDVRAGESNPVGHFTFVAAGLGLQRIEEA